ncbi:aromatic acid exporter family protein [Actinomadura sp. WMMB 499]|uniref:FUSC family protein n=1 Tax=Actinomadura sp. WMMB 499 TaxID=1219491 RepID=UPI0012441788|nr:FUSC family protein [Actinomadura sp. WMMB 499]QFG24444.1 hypothetical protein F7P10_28275 [Actinomadura sp. WMMB 499]
MRAGYLARRLAPRMDRRSWEDRLKITVKAVIAAVAAWLIAKHLVGHAVPYFAPLAALLGVYPTVARSLRESVGYGAGFLVGAGLAVPVGIYIGPNAAGIAVVLVIGLLLSTWRGFGNQAAQVAFTALFALLVGGREVAAYVRPRLDDVVIGLAVGLIVNITIFPPLFLRRGEEAVRQAREYVKEALEVLARSITAPDGDWRPGWDEEEARLGFIIDQARYATEQGRESLRGNPRALLWGFRPWSAPRSGLRGFRLLADPSGQWAAPRRMTTLENTAAYLRSIAGTLREATETGSGEVRLAGPFRERYAGLLGVLAELVGCADGAAEEEEIRARAWERQRELERPFAEPGTDVAGIWDPHKELLRLSRLTLTALSP